MEIQLQRLSHNVGCPSPVSHSLEFLDDTSLYGLHDELDSSSHGLRVANMVASGRTLLKPTLILQPGGDSTKVLGGSKTLEGPRESHQSLKHVVNSTKKTLNSEKENMGWQYTLTRQMLRSRPKGRCDISCSPDARLLRQKKEEGCGKAVHKSRDIMAQMHFEGRSNDHLAEKRDLSTSEMAVSLHKANTPTSTARPFNQAQSADCMEQEETFLDSMMVSREMMRTPLLGQLQTRSCTSTILTRDTHGSSSSLLGTSSKQEKSASRCEHFCDKLMEGGNATATSLSHSKCKSGNEFSHNLPQTHGSEILKGCACSRSEVQCIQEQYMREPEQISGENQEHVVVFFAVQSNCKGGFHRLDLLKFPRLCRQYAHKISAWVISVYQKQHVKTCLQYLQQIFSFSPRGFVHLKTQNLSEFSGKPCSSSSRKKLGNEDELRAVLMKINEVLGSMPRTCPHTAEEAIGIQH